MSTPFDHPHTLERLHWLGEGQLHARLERVIRAWELLRRIYGEENPWDPLPETFAYPDIRERLFSPQHPRQDPPSRSSKLQPCPDPGCICKRPLRHWLPNQDLQTALRLELRLNPQEWAARLNRCPFATTHRTIRKDAQFLATQGWFQALGHRGMLRLTTEDKWPIPPKASKGLNNLRIDRLRHLLEDMAFAQPEVEVLLADLWSAQVEEDTPQRLFIHLDYILSDEQRQQVDDFHEQLEQLWAQEKGVIQFEYDARWQGPINLVAYPVCLHYRRRAKYLTVWGQRPEGGCGWFNTRLDRIRSPRLNILPWGSPEIPAELQARYNIGNLPTPEQVKEAMEEAWGFNFFLPDDLLIIRFPSEFAQRYVTGTFRHHTFQSVGYHQIPALLKRSGVAPDEAQQILAIVHQRSPEDCYFQARVRPDDRDLHFRLREWRPNGEVIAPLKLRRQMTLEVEQELRHYLYRG